MNYSTNYYWQIIAWDNHSESSSGPQWEFTTEASVNNPPNMPKNETPKNTTTNIPITTNLAWVGGDPDVGDVVKYDVYFGTTSTPLKVSSNQSTSTYNPSGDLVE